MQSYGCIQNQIHIKPSGVSFSMENTTNIINEFAYAKYNVYIAMCLLHNA